MKTSHFREIPKKPEPKPKSKKPVPKKKTPKKIKFNGKKKVA